MIVASGRSLQTVRSASGDSRRVWATLGWIGLVFLLVGGADFALVWFPPNFGAREWEFAAVTQSFNGLPILLLGLGLLMVAAEEVERRWWGAVGAGVAGVLFLWVLVGFVLWAMNVPLALETVPENLRMGVQKAVMKTLVQSVAYPTVLAYLMWRAWTGRKDASAGAVDG